MKRLGPWALVSLVCACAGGPRPAADPAPVARSEVADSARTLAAAGVPTDSAVLNSGVDSAPVLPDSVAADSAADAAILERLATSNLELGDTGGEEGTEAVPGGANSAASEEVTYDIDVATYGSHSRVQYYLDFFQGPARERMNVWLQRMPRYESMIRARLKENAVPEDMVYLALIESGYSNSAVSRARATGMWQFMKGTAKLYGLRIDSWVDERRDPVKATDAAARHLADLRDRFGSMYLAAAAYNAGAGKVGRGLRRLGPDDEEEEEENPDATFFRLYDTRFLRRETKDYVPKLIAAALIAKQPEKYGFERHDSIGPLTYDSLIVPDATGLDVVAKLADTTFAAVRELNPQYIRMVTPPRQTAVVRVPPGTGSVVTARYAALEPKERVSFVEHTVTRGQTASGIARSYRISTRLLAEANLGVRMTRLRTGMHLMIPTSFVPPAPAEPMGRTVSAGTSRGTTTIRYRVRSGESLWIIAGKYNTTVERLRSMNAIGRSEVLKAGRVIRVPAPADTVRPAPAVAPRASRALASAGSGRTHLVRRGETLSGIAAHYGISLGDLRQANGMSSRSVLRAGSRLVIP